MIPPIKRGTARRLGIRPPPAAPQWLIDMQEQIKLTAWHMDVIAQIYGQPPWRFRAATLAAKREAAE